MGRFYLSCLSSFMLVSCNLAINIADTPTWPSGRCTDKSLTIPSWIVSDYTVKAGTATFKVVNRANDFAGSVTCASGTTECKVSGGATDLTATWTKNSQGISVVGLSDSWTCADEGDKINFKATGSTTITSCSGSDCVSSITYLAHGTLSLPVPLTPTQPSAPHGYDSPSCAEIGPNQWKVSSVSYKNYTKGQCKQWYFPDLVCTDDTSKDGSFISKGEYLTFHITNNAISHDVLCNFTSTPENSHSLPRPLRCTGGNFDEITLDATVSGTVPNFELKVEQLWSCLENPSTNVNPSLLVASGSIPLPLTCESHTGITGTPDDIVTLCTDSKSSHTIDATQVAKKSLPAFSLVTAYPAHGGCTFDSVVNPTFTYRPYYFATKPYPANDSHSATLENFLAGLSGPGFNDYAFYESKPISGAGLDAGYTCAYYRDGNPTDQHYNCTYSFNPFTKVITQTKVWKCSDKNAVQPLYFTGSGSFDWSRSTSWTCDNSSGVKLSCLYQDGGPLPYRVKEVTVSLVNVLPPDYGK